MMQVWGPPYMSSYATGPKVFIFEVDFGKVIIILVKTVFLMADDVNIFIVEHNPMFTI